MTEQPLRAFGCPICYGDDAPSTNHHLERVSELEDRSHFSLTLMACRTCGQRFVNVWAEFSSFTGGSEFMSSETVPVDDRETERIVSSHDLEYIGSLGRDRRYISGGGGRRTWSTGAFQPMHGY